MAKGFQGERLLSDRIWARLVRNVPPTAVKAPPMNQPPLPSGAMVNTDPATFGKPLRGAPVPASSGTSDPVAGPTWVNVPPM